MIRKKNLLLYGRPGVGKTTIIMKIIELWPREAGGFYTQEVRAKGTRIGFDIITTEGERGMLSRVGHASPWRVGRYGVLREDLEKVAVSSIRQALAERKLVVIDEIGKMELFSNNFREVVLQAFHSAPPVLATIMEAYHPFAQSLKQRADVELIKVEEKNRDRLPQLIVEKIKLLYLGKNSPY